MSAAQPLISDLVDQHYQTLYRFALSLARNEADASDLTQQTFFLFATKGQQLRDPKKAKSWLATTLYREFLHNKRRSNRFDPIATPSSDSTDGADEPSFTPDLPQQLDAASALSVVRWSGANRIDELSGLGNEV
jgi:RNA polymerase sigma-70 factor (ECF subfamily)